VAELEEVLASARRHAETATTTWQPLQQEADGAVAAVEAARADAEHAKQQAESARSALAAVDGTTGDPSGSRR
jgi:cell pole-organizing protein PopZ